MIGPFHLYGLCTAGAALLALILMQLTRKKHDLSSETVSWFAVLSVPFAVFFARVGYFLVRLNYFREKGFLSFFRFDQGGYILYGALLGVLIAAAVAAKITRTPISSVLDAAAGPGMIAVCCCRMSEKLVFQGYGMAIVEWFGDPFLLEFDPSARIPSSFLWEDPSPLFHFPLAVQMDGIWYFSIFFWEALAAAAIGLFILLMKRRAPGGHVTLALLLYAACQILLESLRKDAVLTWGFVKVSQLLSAITIGVIALICCIRLRGQPRQRGRMITAWISIFALLGIVIAMEFALDEKISFLSWMHMDLCYLVIGLVSAGIVFAVYPLWKRAFPLHKPQ